ncbi:hypothetical protein WA026_016681 [Henosepilachna vigintioctopunctata]|uniref:Uncharacterized protein n=1 Tax=Henosepilachna vigintioctopunctata TaxID=420089 RepID=A0AAW1UV75_9CUCU
MVCVCPTSLPNHHLSALLAPEDITSNSELCESVRWQNTLDNAIGIGLKPYKLIDKRKLGVIDVWMPCGELNPFGGEEMERSRLLNFE